MGRAAMVPLIAAILASLVQFTAVNGEETILSAVLTPSDNDRTIRQERSYYERYGTGRFNDDRSKCGRCLDDRYDDRDDDRGRDRYDDDRRPNRPTYGNRHDRNKNYDNDDDDRRYNSDRKNSPKNGTEDDNNDDKKKPYDDKDRDRDRPSGGRRDRDRHRYDDRDKYRPDYYDRFLRDPYRDRYDRPYYEDSYRERRPYYDRYDEGYGGRYEGYGYRRPAYDDRYDRGTGYDDYGGYGPGVGRGPHDSFRPWDETYRGQAGWDAGGRGYYFASGRPDATSAWSRPEYSRPESGSGWQSSGYSGGYSTYRDPVDYRGSVGYSDGGYRQDVSTAYGQAAGYGQGYGQAAGYGQGYGQASGWRNVGERRPYRDQSGVSQSDKGIYKQPTRNDDRYDQNRQNGYGQQNQYQQNSYQPNSQSTTTPATSYLYQREDEHVTKTADESTKPPS
ncbi:uncharacterized protein [Epargyreus clarus]|uniref:uncharacterized protein isoform X2 n=1 Tax=Epargyreus clarus TaxID=520877 RepID=UPI003C2BE438